MYLRIRKNCVITALLIFCLLNLASLDFIGGNALNMLNNLLRVVAAVCALLLYVIERRRKLSAMVLLTVIMQFWVLFSTIINHGSLRSCVLSAGSIMALVFVFESMHANGKDFVHGFMAVSELVCYANLVSILLYPNGMYRNVTTAYSWSTELNWLLGNKNNFTPYLLVFCVVAYLYRSQGGSPVREWGIYIASLISVLLARSSASIIGFALLPIGFLIARRSKIKLNASFFLAVNAALFLIIVVFRLQDVFSIVIEFVLNKSLSFTGRTILWDKVFKLIGEKPLLGYGLQETGYLITLTNVRFGMHAHNIVLQYFFEGGIIYLGLYVTMLIMITRRLKKVEQSPEARCIIIALFLFLVMALMEPYRNPFVYVLYFFGYYIKDFIEQDQKPQKVSLLNSGF